MEVAPGAELRGWQASSLPAAVLAFGLLLSAAIGGLAALMRRVGRQRALAFEAQDRLAAEVDRRAQTEVQLGRTLTFLHCVLDSTSFSVIGTDLDGVIRTFNRSAERMLGYSAEELIGSTTPLILHDPNELAQRAVQLSIELERPVAPGVEVFQAATRRGQVDRRDWTYVRKDGTRFPVELSINGTLDAEGRLTGFMCTAVDVTERRHMDLLRRWAEDSLRRTQELLQSVLDASLNGVLAFKCVRADDGAIIDLECVLANAAAERLLGDSRGSLVGRSHHEVTGSDPANPLFQSYAAVVDTGEPVDMEHQGRGFGNRWFRIIATPLGHDGLAVTFEDITRRKEIDTQLASHIEDLWVSRDRIHQQSEQLQAQATELTRARDEALAGAREMERALKIQADFVSFASHQLRTPLSGIRWLLELAREEPGQSRDMRSYLADCLASTERLIGLVNDLLDVSRLEGGRGTPELVELNLAAVCRGVLEYLRPNLEQAKHALTVTGLDAAAPVLADPQLMRQVVENLLSNAIKYTPPGGHVALHLAHTADGVRCVVADDGIGVPEAARLQLFEKFFRADNVAAIEAEGTGLGLYMVRLILQRFGGIVWHEAPAGGGSRFVFALPVAAARGVDHAAA